MVVILNKPLTRRDAVVKGTAAAVGLAAVASPLGSAALKAAVARSGVREVVYVCNALEDTVTVIDVGSSKVSNTIHMNWGTKRSVPRWPFSLGSVMVANAPMNATFTPDGRNVWVPNAKGRNIAVLDVATNAIVKKIALPMDPCDVKFTPDGRKAIATLIGDTFVTQGGVIIIDVASGSFSPIILTGTQPEQLAITPDGKRVYNVSKSMWVVDVEKAAVECEIYLPYHCYDLAVSPDGKQVYAAASFGGDKIVVIDNGPGPYGVKVTGTIEANEPCCMAFSPEGSLMYVTSNSKSTIQIYDMMLKMVVMTAPVPAMPSEMAITADGKKMFMAHNIGDSISVLDTRTLEVIGRIKCGDQPNSVAIGSV
jgi:YVTN family beta-propeller protein